MEVHTAEVFDLSLEDRFPIASIFEKPFEQGADSALRFPKPPAIRDTVISNMFAIVTAKRKSWVTCTDEDPHLSRGRSAQQFWTPHRLCFL